MDQRIGFESNEMRREFFDDVRVRTGIKNWEQFYKCFGVARSMFQKYRYGQLLIPKVLFDRIIGLLSDEKVYFFSKQVFTEQGNWGVIKGGKENYKKNPKRNIKQLRKGFQKYIKRKKEKILFVQVFKPC